MREQYTRRMRIAHRLEIINRSTTAPNAGDWGEYHTGGGGGGDGGDGGEGEGEGGGRGGGEGAHHSPYLPSTAFVRSWYPWAHLLIRLIKFV